MDDKPLVEWMDKAVDAYLKHRFYEVLGRVGKISDAQLLCDWNDLLDDTTAPKRTGKSLFLQWRMRDNRRKSVFRQKHG